MIDEIFNQYEPVIGLEIHIQLSTLSKAYSSDSAEFGAMPNNHISEITLAHPGTLPKHNKKAIELAIKMGIALDCDIRKENQYARKNYFYADLPKGYQITQDKTPICNNGNVKIKLKDGTHKNIAITRIHLEEDSGKSMHDQDLVDSLIDYNRAGVALIELVTEPVIKSAEEAYAFVTEIRKLVRYLDICDGNMEEGSLRCDANVSVMKKGTNIFGTKVEVKNMNSISNVKRAIEFEILRQIDLLEKGEGYPSETRGFNAVKGTTFSLRAKELANDYRYFPEPDLPPFIVTHTLIEDIKSHMPDLPEKIYLKLKNEYNLPEYDALLISDDKYTANYFFEITKHTTNFKSSANWLLGSVKAWLNDNAKEITDFQFPAIKIAELIKLVDDGKISNTIATQNIFPELVKSPEKSAISITEELNLIQSNDNELIENLARKVLDSMPDKVAEYKNGKVGLLGLFVGELMKLSQGKANPKIANEFIKKLVDN